MGSRIAGKERFIDLIGACVQKHAPQYGIQVCSPIIGQAILESAWGTDYKATYGHNYFGLKYREDRVSVSCGKFLDGSAEQNADGSYTSITDYWFQFRNMEEGVVGYFQFIDTPNYAALKGLRNPRAYLEAIKEARYATSIDYVEKVMAVVDGYNLRRFDMAEEREGSTMRFNIHAGHNQDGSVACGAIGFVRESTEARRVKDAVISQLRQLGHTVHDCTVDSASGVSTNLSQIVSKCNAHEVDLDVSIHFNSGAGDSAGNGKTTGTEVYVYNAASKARGYAERVCAAIAGLGYRNRGVKYSTGLYVLRNTKSPAMLIECCFVDDKDDVQLYDCQKMAEAIVYGITGQLVHTAEKQPDVNQELVDSGEETAAGDKKQLYRVQVGAYSVKGNADVVQARLKAAGFDAIIVNA